MKIYLTVFVAWALSLFVPAVSFAAYSDVTLNPGVVVNVAGIDLTVSGSDTVVQEMTVNADTISNIVMPAGSIVKVSSADRRKLTIPEVASFQVTSSCSSSESIYTITNPSQGETATTSIGVETSTCAAGGGGGGSGGGGSGGGGSSGGGGGGGGAPAVPVATPVAPTVAKPSIVAQTISPVFNTDLVVGRSRGDDVKRLQELLRQDKEIYPEGIANGVFGPLTEKAVKRFQAKYGLPQVGRVGPATRAKLEEVFGGKKEAPKETPVEAVSAGSVSAVFTADLSKGTTSDDVSRLQQLLAQDKEIYPAGTVSGFYGSLTEGAVRKFQAKYGLPQVGRVGPATRAKLKEVFGEKVITPAAAPVVVPQANPIQSVVPPATTEVKPVNQDELPAWMRLTPVPRAGGSSATDAAASASQ